MSLFGKRIEDVELADIQELLDNTKRESQSLDYKMCIPDLADHKKRIAFLCDIVAFANSRGGHLIYGVKAKDGVPVEIIGIGDRDSEDNLRLRISNLIYANIEPHLSGVQTVGIPIGDDRWVLVIRVPLSWAAPHFVDDDRRFRGRNTAGNYPLSIMEIKNAFLKSSAVVQRAEEFRNSRIENFGKWPRVETLVGTARIIVHLIPLQSLDMGDTIVFEPEQTFHDLLRPFVVLNDHYEHSYNFSGFVTCSRDQGFQYAWSYSLLFRNGIIEGADSFTLWPGEKTRDQSPPLFIRPQLEKCTIEAVESYLALYEFLQISPPVLVCLTLKEVQSYRIAYNPNRFGDHRDRAIAEKDLLLSPVVIEDFSVDPKRVLRPAFDRIWNACGIAKSLNYDSEGNWRPSTSQ